MVKELLGPGLVLVFAVSQAFRDVYFANVFQGTDFFLVIALAFSISALVFAAVTAIRAPAALVGLRRELPALAWINVTTAVAWISYFYSLKHLQPSVVNTLHSGAGPLTVIVLAACGIHIARPSAVRQGELMCYAGLAAALAFICWAVLAGHAGLGASSIVVAASLLLPVVSGAAIAPLSAHVIRALGPVVIFAVELADGRIAYSGPILAGIVLYSLFAVAGSLARGWHGRLRANVSGIEDPSGGELRYISAQR